MSESSKSVVRRFFESANNRDLAALDDIVDPQVTFHGMEVSSLDQLKLKVQEILSAFADVQLTIEDLIVEADRAAVRLSFRGTHTGEFEGMPATGRPIDAVEMDFLRLENGKIVEVWQLYDNAKILMQLGLFPEPAGAE